MAERSFRLLFAALIAIALVIPSTAIFAQMGGGGTGTMTMSEGSGKGPGNQTFHGIVTPAERKAAADRVAKSKAAAVGAAREPSGKAGRGAVAAAVLTPGGVPDYFGSIANFANSPLPLTAAQTLVVISDATGTGAVATPVVTAGVVTGVTVLSGGTGYSATTAVTITGSGTGATASATVTAGVVTGITVTAGGTGYADSLVVNITGGTGTGATAVATAANGSVAAITLVNGGTGYVSAGVTITDATGTGATAVPIVDSANGVITAVSVTNAGLGYSASPVVAITGSGAGATAVAFVSGGSILGIVITNGGAGYFAPIITVTGGGGTGATASASVAGGALTSITLTSGGSGYYVTKNANGTLVGGVRKFVDSLPGLGPTGANNLGQYIPVAVPDTVTYPGSDYYIIAVQQYTEKMHSDLLPTTLRGYVQLNNGTDATGANTVAPAPIHYLGPLIIAQKDRPVRVKFINQLPTGAAGNLFIPVDTTLMGAGTGPLGGAEMYTQNRATLHLHGGRTPWISDGTPHQWTTPATEATSYPKGVSVVNVPDMDGGNEPPGTLTFYYTNQQSARLMFYHDHAWGITRLNVYVGEAAGYLVTDPAEQSLVATGALPADQIPLIIQDRTFLPSAAQLAATDPTWPFPIDATKSNLWFPHVYMPNQNPVDPNGVNAMGRWDYGPWFWPPVLTLAHGPVPNPLVGTTPTEGPNNPGTPNPTQIPEGFMDTPVVNGTAYPVLTVQQKAYRFRILNAANDRTWNLQLYYAKSNKTMWDPLTGGLLDANAGEVNMVPANPNAGLPANWPTDGRVGGVPDPRAVGPSMIQYGTEGGFLPAPVVLPNTPIGYDYNRRSITVLNVLNSTLFLGPAERADVIVDFSQVPVGSNLILYNDAPAPVPGFDPRNDYYTGCPDQTSTGGVPPTQPGYGPNTRTIMQIKVVAAPTVQPAFNLAALQSAMTAAYSTAQPRPIVPEAVYGPAYGTSFTNTYSTIQATSLTFTPVGQAAPITMNLVPKTIQELFDMEYGRMNSILGVELPLTNIMTQTTVTQEYVDPPTEVLVGTQDAVPIGSANDGTQIWKITHNGVDTHAVHFHMFDLQLLNRVGWDGMVKPPDPNEVGWKETIRMNPLEDIIVALRPIYPIVPFSLPNSIRPLDPSNPIGSTFGFTNVNPLGNPVTITNQIVNFGYEYVWHCHLLGHEELDMMRSVAVAVPPETPSALAAKVTTSPLTVSLSWNDNSKNATGFTVQRATDVTFVAGLTTFPVIDGPTNPQTYVDTTAAGNTTYYYRVIATVAVGSTFVGYPQATAESSPSNVVTVKTPNVPSAPVNLVVAASQGGQLAALLTWTDTSTSATSFTVQRATNTLFTTGLQTFTARKRAGAAQNYSDTSVVKNVTYYYRVFATNANGSSGPSNIVTAGPPAAPTNIVLAQTATLNPASISVSWLDNSPSAAVPPNWNAELNFTVRRATTATGPWTTLSTAVPAGVGTGTTVIFTDQTNVRSKTTYYYEVAATNAFGSSGDTISGPITTR